MTPYHNRIEREKRTIRAMVKIYCRSQHATRKGLCEQCQELYTYAVCRLDRCPFGRDKTTCERCPVHCYMPAMRAKIREAMHFAGPRMLFRHPVLAVLHKLDSLRGLL